LEVTSATNALKESHRQREKDWELERSTLGAERDASAEFERSTNANVDGARDVIMVLRRANSCERLLRIVELQAGAPANKWRVYRGLHSWMTNFLEFKSLSLYKALESTSGRAGMVAGDVLVLAEQAEESATLLGMLLN